ncbi:ATP-dependent RNA helicase HrpA [Wenzhouxiangella marina]|nr:ATP-dependent RNA helicase HrpA [Wenzhouxiangella marina]MBB6087893.1 ATP-dependent helicase HrpA [Wenzhouxiangella marina]
MPLDPLEPDALMQRDLAWLKRRRGQLEGFRGPTEKRDRLQAQYEQRLARSRDLRQQRGETVPTVQPAPDLPISQRESELIEAIAEHQVLIVAGETGSGKSTRLPQLCLQAGRGQRGLIGCTQPRRIAARSVARRVAQELRDELGGLVGFQVRFNEKVSERTWIKFMTDGVALAEIHQDRHLDRYDTLIIDEAHERSLNIDFLLGYLKKLLPRRPDLKLIITSATIDTERFSKHFTDAPVITVEGRSYPVEMRYQAPNDGEDLGAQVVRAVHAASRVDPRGDILVFLPGEREIFQVARSLRRQPLAHTEILPLYARLPTASQDAIFRPGTGRRIVLATNVAETSLTVPGIRFVIDSGLARISRYAAHSRVLRLPIEPVSKAACNQRAGRCGRVGPGLCIRLFDEDDFERRPDYTEPEIQRAGLVGVVLEMLALGLGDPEQFPFIDAPPRRLIGEAWQSLVELGAVDEERRLTRLGQQLARLPVDARHGRILIEAQQRGCLAEVLVLVAALSLQDVRERPLDQQQAADQAHREFVVQGSDFLTLLKLWHWWQDTRRDHSRSQADRLARKHFLSVPRLHEWGQLQGQLAQIAREEGWKTGKTQPEDQRDPAREQAIHRSLLAGLLSLVGQHQEQGEYQGARGHKFRIFPGSVLGKRSPAWVMAAELVETGRTYARLVAPIEPAWLEQQAAHLTKRRVFDPWWDRRSGRVMGYEQISLHGLILVEKRRTHFGPHDPVTARRLFIRHALVRGEMHHRAEFLKRNRALRAELAEHEHKRRRRDVLAAEAELEHFFDQRLPEQIYTTKAFAAWYEGLTAEARDRLLYDRATLLREEAELAEADAFPARLRIGRESFSLDYRFEPGSEADGVTLNCPLHLLNQLKPAQLSWLVPGLLRDKIEALIGSLPKSKRRALVPIKDFARAAHEALMGRDIVPERSLETALARELARMSGLEIDAADFQREKIPDHLCMRVRLRDEDGKLLGESRNLSELIEGFADRARAEFMTRQSDQWQQDGLSAAELPELPALITTRGGHRAWPALVEQGNRVGVRLFDREADAHEAHREGVTTLLRQALSDKWKYLRKHNGLSQAAQIAWTRIEDVGDLSESLRGMALQTFLGEAWTVRSRGDFDALLKQVRQGLIERYQSLAGKLDACLIRWHELSVAIDSLADAVPRAHADLRSQLDDLMYAGFLDDLSAERLSEYPRYLEAIGQRIEIIEYDPRRDHDRMAQVEPWWQRYLDHLNESGIYSEALDRYRWLVEEYRIQVFAQKLGTRHKVSPARLEAAWAEVEAEG